MPRDWIGASGVSEAETRGLAQWIVPSPASPLEPALAWLGHASFSLAWARGRLLVDPVFKNWIGWYRRRTPTPERSCLSRPRAIAVTHAHMDHLDPAEIERLEPQMVILPAGSERLLPRRLRSKAMGLKLGEAIDLPGARVTSVAAAHGGWRYPWQRGLRASGYLVQLQGQSFYFCGDSAYGPHFREIGRNYQIDTAILPIGAYAPRFFMRCRHMDPAEAWRAANDLDANEVVPSHFGTYRLSLEGLATPMRRFASLGESKPRRWRLPIGLPRVRAR